MKTIESNNVKIMHKEYTTQM